MGAEYNGVCYPDSASALTAFYTQAKPGITAANPPTISVPTFASSVWDIDTYQNGSLVNSVAAPVPGFASCDPTAGFFNGIEIGWAVATCFIIAACFRFLARPMGGA